MITLAFFVSLLYLYFVLFLTQKSTLSDAFFGVFGFGTVLFLVLRRFPRVTRRGSSSGGGQICQNAEIPPSFMSLPCIFCKRMHLQYIEAFLVSTPWGFAPNPNLTCGAAEGRRLKPNHLTLWRSVGSAQGVKGKMHGFAALDPSPPP